MKQKSYLQLIFGPMWAGKTTELIRMLERYKYAKKSVFVINHVKDKRYGTDAIITHQLIGKKAHSTDDLFKTIDEAKKFDIIGIDEAQFFKGLKDFTLELLNLGKVVIISGLHTCHKKEKFGEIMDLIPHADLLTHLDAIDPECGRHAPFFVRTRKIKDHYAVGGGDLYSSRCGSCWEKYKEFM